MKTEPFVEGECDNILMSL